MTQGGGLEQHRDVERAQHKAARVIVLSAIVLVTLALALIGFVLWALLQQKHSGEVRTPCGSRTALCLGAAPARVTAPAFCDSGAEPALVQVRL